MQTHAHSLSLPFLPPSPPLALSLFFSPPHTQVPDTENGGGRYERVSNLEKRPALSGVCVCVRMCACVIDFAREEGGGEKREQQSVYTHTHTYRHTHESVCMFWVSRVL